MDELDDVIISHPSYNQVLLDVNRCAGRLGEGEKSEHEQKKLVTLIVKLLIEKPDLCYYQGFHDVSLTCLLMKGEDGALKTMQSLIDSHLHTFMQPSIKDTEEMLRLIPIIVGLENSKLNEFMDRSGVGTIYSLSWVITWFGHVIPQEDQIEDLFEFFASNHPYLVLYLSAAIVLLKADNIVKLECDMSAVHCYLSRVPRTSNLPIEKLKRRSLELFDKYPPEYILSLRIRQDRIKRFRGAISQLPTRRSAIIVFILVSAIVYQYARRII